MLALVGAALWALRGQLPSVVAVADQVHPRWPLVAAASAIVLLTYAQLIEGWRRVLAAMGGALPVAAAARIWLVSNLARYLPLVGWQLAAMTEMTRRQGVPVAISTGSAVLLTIVNVFAALGVAGAFAFATVRAQLGPRGWTIVALGVLALAAAPLLVPRAGALLRRLTGRELAMPRFGLRAVLVAALSTTVAWLAYGVAFWLMTRAILPGEARGLAGCIALYTLSYLAGLFNPAPAGVGAAEGMMVLLAPQLGVATRAEAVVLSVVVRIWRTVLEVLPGVIAMVATRSPDDGAAAQPSRGSRIP